MSYKKALEAFENIPEERRELTSGDFFDRSGEDEDEDGDVIDGEIIGCCAIGMLFLESSLDHGMIGNGRIEYATARFYGMTKDESNEIISLNDGFHGNDGERFLNVLDFMRKEVEKENRNEKNK